MKPVSRIRHSRTRLLRRVLLVLVVVVVAAVGWSLYKPAARSGTAAPVEATGKQGTTVHDAFFVRFSEGRRPIEVKAKTWEGSDGATVKLRSVEVTFPYTRQGGAAGTAKIRANEATYKPQPLQMSFQGDVHVETDDGMTLDSQSLDYAGDSGNGTARTDTDVRFAQKSLSGTAHGMQYGGGTLTLDSQVRLRVTSASGPPADVEAGSAKVSKEESRVYFEGGVAVRQGNRELKADRLQLNMSDNFGEVQRAAAIENVELRVGPGTPLPGTPAVGGEKRLRCRRLNIAFREGGGLESASAVNPAVLEMLPGPRETPERRVLATSVILFGFDEQGKLTSLEGRADAAPEAPPDQRTTVLTTEPLRGHTGQPRRVECRNLLAQLDPVSGALQKARFDTRVVFSEPGRHAWAQQADFDDGPGMLALSGDPRVVDEAQGSDLRAQKIVLGTRSHSVTADENVRHTITRRPAAADAGAANGAAAKGGVAAKGGGAKAGAAKASPGPLGSGDEPTVLLCRHFEYDSASKTARYRENALMRSGRDEIRAPLIVIEEPAEGRRRLSASGGVASLLHPRPQKGQTKEPAVIEARSKELVYEEKEHRVVYTGDVEVKQGDIFTKSPEAVVLLTPDNGAVERMLAGSPVEVRQGTRYAKGDRGTYTPKDDTLVLVGEKVVLQDADRKLEGRVLTFQSGSDRIRVDGREEVRTEAVLKRKEPPKP